jgi:hypothetical protein
MHDLQPQTMEGVAQSVARTIEEFQSTSTAMGDPRFYLDFATINLVFAHDMTSTQDLRICFVRMIAYVGSWLRERFPRDARLVYDAFAQEQISPTRQRIRFHVTDVTQEMQARRERCRNATVAFLHCKPLYIPDLMQIIARYMWNTREHEVWQTVWQAPQRCRILSWTM